MIATHASQPVRVYIDAGAGRLRPARFTLGRGRGRGARVFDAPLFAHQAAARRWLSMHGSEDAKYVLVDASV